MFDDDVRRLIEKEAAAAKIPAHHLLAVVEVESAGKAYAMVKGRKEPLIRWEGHYFDRLLSPADRAIARKQGLASPKAGGVANPNGQPARYALLDRAILIDAKAAFESCSWGVGQVMGSHWKSLGYSSVEALVTEARRDVGGQVRLMVKFIVENNLLDEIRSGAWAKFARAYNGPAYKKNAYDTKMAKAAARWAKAKPLTATGKPADAPKPPPAPAVVLTPQPTPAPVPVAPIADLTGDAALIANPVSEVLTSKYPAPDPMPNGKSLTAKQKIVYAVQAWLKDLNYNPGGLDGKDGPLTASAIRDARADNGLIEGDQIDVLFIEALPSMKPRKLTAERATATPTEVAARKPEVNGTWWQRLVASVSGFFLLIASYIGDFFTWVLSNLGVTKQHIDNIKEYFPELSPQLLLIIGAVICFGLFWIAHSTLRKQTDSFQKGDLR